MLTYRPIAKVVSRLAKKYGFDDSVIPNYKFTKTCGYLHFLYRDYEKDRINQPSFRELVNVHAYNYALRKDFVWYVAASQARDEAIYWYKEFKLHPSDCPPDIKVHISNIGRGVAHYVSNAPSNGTEASNCEVYLTIDLPDESLIIVDTAMKFDEMLNELQRQQTIYLDSEWVQNICGESQLCVLQIATDNFVYLIDCLARESIQQEQWRLMGANVFNNVNILKVGFSMACDLSVLQRSLPLQLRLHTPHHYLDLRSLWLQLKKQHAGVELPFGNINRAGDALSHLSFLCLGKKLNKSNQCSNWTNRPLRREQIIYAGEYEPSPLSTFLSIY